MECTSLATQLLLAESALPRDTGGNSSNQEALKSLRKVSFKSLKMAALK